MPPLFFRRSLGMTANLARSTFVALASVVLLVSAAVYLPGISGPYVFDDRYNILSNSFLQLQSLDIKALYHASFSVGSGPLLRPVSMLSFALNHYFAGGFEDSTPLKLTNLAIHIINGLLVFWLMRLIFRRAAGTSAPAVGTETGLAERSDYLAAAVALLWIVHPINLTSVLYVVQRMTSLSALFTLLGLISYLKGRTRFLANRSGGIWLIAFGLFGCGGIGVLSKENAALLPLFILALECMLFADEEPWRSWSRLPARLRRTILSTLFAALAIAVVWAVSIIAVRYGGRTFTMTERVLTEARVLFFYLFLLLIPRTDRFGLYHDDIPLSTSLFSPWTTLPSVAGIIGLCVLALLVRRRLPLLALGIIWFFIGHLLESTIIPLEIAHEHRNYLAGIGVFLALVHLVDRYSRSPRASSAWLAYALLALIFAGATLLRANQWSDHYTLARYEALHHPSSAQAQALLASATYMAKDYEAALHASLRASALAPGEPGYRINAEIARVRLGLSPDPVQMAEIKGLIAKRPPSIVTQMTLQYVTSCIANECTRLQNGLESWLRTLVESDSARVDRSFYYYLLGRTLLAQGKTLDALNALERSAQYDRRYLHPLFLLAAVFVELGQVENAELMLERIRAVNNLTVHPRHREASQLAEIIENLKRGRAPAVAGEALRNKLAPAPEGPAMAKD